MGYMYSKTPVTNKYYRADSSLSWIFDFSGNFQFRKDFIGEGISLE